MLRLKLVKGVDLVDDEDDGVPTETSLLHGTNVLSNVVSPWFGSHRIVCADSYFASVGTAKGLYKNGLRFIGVIKTATKGFPNHFCRVLSLNYVVTSVLSRPCPPMRVIPSLHHLCGWIVSDDTLSRRQDPCRLDCHIRAVAGGKSVTSQMPLHKR